MTMALEKRGRLLWTRRGYALFIVVCWLGANAVGTLGVGYVLHESLAGYLFTGALMTIGVGVGSWASWKLFGPGGRGA